MRGLVLAFGILSFTAGCASNRAAPTASAGTLAAAGTPKAAADENKDLVCFNEYPVGSHIPERVCHPPTASTGYPSNRLLGGQDAEVVKLKGK